VYVNRRCNFGTQKCDQERNQEDFIYKDLTIEKWTVETKVIPVVTWETGTTLKSFRKYMTNTTGKHQIKELQKTAIFSTASHISESTNVKVQNIQHRK
jgi:hypothetical protein